MALSDTPENIVTVRRDGRFFNEVKFGPGSGRIVNGPFETETEAKIATNAGARDVPQAQLDDDTRKILERRASGKGVLSKEAKSILEKRASEKSLAEETVGQFIRGVGEAGAFFRPINPLPPGPQIPLAADEPPDSLVGRIFNLGGASAGLTAAGGPFASQVPRAAAVGGGLLERGVTGIQNFVSGAGRTFAGAPGRSVVREGVLGGAAGAGGHFALEVFPDSTAAQFVGEILGGTVGSAGPKFIPSMVILRGIKSGTKQVRNFIAGVGRAEERVGRALGSEEARKRALKELESETTLDPETGRPVLSLSQRTASAEGPDVGLLPIEAAIKEADDQALIGFNAQIAQANEVIDQVAREIPDAATDGFENVQVARMYMATMLDTALVQAAEITDARIGQLGKQATKNDATKIARDEVQRVIRAGRTQEKQLFNTIDGTLKAPTRNGQTRLQQLIKEQKAAGLSDIPMVARRLLGKPKLKNPKQIAAAKRGAFLGDVTDVGELRSLYSQLRGIARDKRGGLNPNSNMARIADELADSVRDDIAQAQGTPRQRRRVEVAVGYSRDFHRRIGQTSIAKLTERTKTGALKVPRELTLQESLGVSGDPRSAQSVREFRRLFSSRGRVGQAESRTFFAAAEDWIKSDFLQTVSPNGTFDVEAGQKYLARHRELLAEMPDVGKQLSSAVESGRVEAVRGARAKQRLSRLNDPRVSKAAVFVQQGPEEFFRQISDLIPQRAAFETQKLINRAAKDETGTAMMGMKSALISHLLASAKKGGAKDAAGNIIPSGFELKRLMGNRTMRVVIGKTLTADESRRLNVIANDLVKIEKTLKTPASKEGILGDKPAKALEAMLGIVGAATGRKTAGRLGVGATVQIPGIVAQRFRDLGRAFVNQPGERLIVDSALDETLFKGLINKTLPKGAADLGPDQARIFNAWAAAVAAEHGIGLSEDEAP